MNLEELRKYLDQLLNSLKQEDKKLLEARLQGLTSIFPFSEYEYILTFLVDRGTVSFEGYEKLRNNYVSTNRYLGLFGLAPRIFGQIWGEKHVMDLDHRFRKPDPSVDPSYEGQYDLWLDGIRIELKAARAIHTKKRGDLVSKALRYESGDPFWMNFQQLKPDACEVFVFIGVWVDQIVYWVMSTAEVKSNRYLSHQHRGGIEYQIGITDKNIRDFDRYRTTADGVAALVLRKGR